MKILKFTKFILGIGGLVVVGGGVPVGTLSASAPGLQQIQTRHGTLYSEVEILDADRHGLLFRHARGIAKLPFDELSENLRLRYKPVEGTPEASAVDGSAGGADKSPVSSPPGDGFPGEPGTPSAKAEGEERDETVAGSTDGGLGPHSIHLVARVRWHVQMPLPGPSRIFWQSHWPRRPLSPFDDFHPTPVNRAAALHALLRAAEASGTGRCSHSPLGFD